MLGWMARETGVILSESCYREEPREIINCNFGSSGILRHAQNDKMSLTVRFPKWWARWLERFHQDENQNQKE